MFPRPEGQAPEDLLTGVVSSCEGSPSAGCRKTCWRGAKLTEILAMGYSTYWLALGCRCSSCRNNGRFLEMPRVCDPVGLVLIALGVALIVLRLVLPGVCAFAVPFRAQSVRFFPIRFRPCAELVGAL